MSGPNKQAALKKFLSQQYNQGFKVDQMMRDNNSDRTSLNEETEQQTSAPP